MRVSKRICSVCELRYFVSTATAPCGHGQGTFRAQGKASATLIPMRCAFAWLLLSAAAAWPATIAEKTKDTEKLPGFFPLYWDAKNGKVWIEIDKWDSEFLYIDSLPAGLGSNDVGLDRGQLGASGSCDSTGSDRGCCSRSPTMGYRASTENRRARARWRSRSPIRALGLQGRGRGRPPPDGRDRLRPPRCARRDPRCSGRGRGPTGSTPPAARVYLPRTRAFPRNSEIEVTLTFGGEPTGGFVREVAPPRSGDGAAASLLRRAARPGVHAPRVRPARRLLRYLVLSTSRTPIREPITKRFITRHRLQKRDPSAAVSEPVEPIVYYLDPGAPEPVRTRAAGRRALVEPGLRGGGLSQRVPGRGAAGQRRSDGRALQHDPVGAPLHARLELRREHHRSANRRDHQGPRDTGVAAHPSGLHARRGAARCRTSRARALSRSGGDGPGPASGSSRRTRWGTRWGSRTTTSRARRAARR